MKTNLMHLPGEINLLLHLRNDLDHAKHILVLYFLRGCVHPELLQPLLKPLQRSFCNGDPQSFSHPPLVKQWHKMVQLAELTFIVVCPHCSKAKRIWGCKVGLIFAWHCLWQGNPSMKNPIQWLKFHIGTEVRVKTHNVALLLPGWC